MPVCVCLPLCVPVYVCERGVPLCVYVCVFVCVCVMYASICPCVCVDLALWCVLCVCMCVSIPLCLCVFVRGVGDCRGSKGRVEGINMLKLIRHSLMV